MKVISTDPDTLIGSIDVGAKPAGLAITPDGSHVLAAVGGANELVLIDTASNAVQKHVPVAAAHASCVTSDGHYAYVGSQATSQPAVIEVDLLGTAEPKTFAVDRSPRMLSCTSGKIYFTAVGLDAVEMMDPNSGALAVPISTGGSPHDVRATPDGKLELVVSQTAGDLELIDPSSETVSARVPTGKLAHWITLFADGTRAYVTNEGDDNVVIVDIAGRAVISTIAIGKAPRKMALQP